jgi:hypothetical protein
LEIVHTVIRFMLQLYGISIVLYTEGWVCDVALTEYTLGSGETQEGVGILEGRVQGANGGQRELVYEQPETEVDDFCHSWRVPSK